MRIHWIALVLALMLAPCAWSQSLTLELKNGDRVTGRIVTETPEAVVLSNAWAARIAIPLADIAKRTLITNAAIAATAVTNKTATNVVALAKAVASTNTLFNSPLLKNWHGELQVGADLTFSELNRQIYNAKSKLVYTNRQFKGFIDYDTTYGRSEIQETIIIGGVSHTEKKTVTDANRMNGSVKLEYDLTKKWYVYNLGAAGYDEIRKIDLRYEIGPGLGYRMIQRTNFTLNTEAGFNYQDEEHSDHTSISTFFFRFAENAAWKLSPRLTWDEHFEYTPRVEEPSDFRMRFETNLRYALLQNIYLNLSLVDIYDSQPATGVSQNDLQVRSAVGVKF